MPNLLQGISNQNNLQQIQAQLEGLTNPQDMHRYHYTCVVGPSLFVVPTPYHLYTPPQIDVELIKASIWY